MLNISIASDLHLSEYDRFIEDSLIPQPDNVLLLAGDISILYINHKRYVYDKKYSQGWYGLIDWLADNFKFTCLVPGNHEFFNNTLDGGLGIIKKLNKYNPDKFIILYNDYIHLQNNFWVAGTTLWSDIPFKAKHLNTDNNKILNWGTDKNNNEHRVAVSFLKRMRNIKINNVKPVWIVLTHHAPKMCDTSNFFYSVEDSNHGYSTDLGDLVSMSKIWVFGHTHWNVCYKYDDSYIVSNCHGKKNENTNNPFLKNYTITLEYLKNH